MVDPVGKAGVGPRRSGARAHVAGPYRIYNLATHKSVRVQTLTEARDKAPANCCVQVLGADGTVVAWRGHGVWHGAVA